MTIRQFDKRYEKLFEPIKLANTYFRNRIFAAPTGFQDMDKDGIIAPEAAYYYGRKAMGGVASVTVGECVVDTELGKGSDLHICLDNPFAFQGLSRVAGEVSRNGAVCSAELQHGGMYANRKSDPPGVAYGPVECVDIDGRHIQKMPEEIIEQIIEKYAKGAAFAKRCGFGMVTVHGGHGWLLHQFMSPKINKRKDKWGGADIENRSRLAVEVCKAIRKEVGHNFPIEIRISGSECYDGGYDIDEGVEYAKQLSPHVDLMHVSAGSHEVEEVFTVTHPSLFLPDGVNVKYAAEVKKHIDIPVATVGALGDPELMTEILASGKADVIEIARGILADPDLPIKIRTGRSTEVRKCMRCLACFSELINTGHFSCAINPEIGHEEESRYRLPDVEALNVLVVGGGVAGMQAALTSAIRGHNVTLCEKSDKLGGTLLCEEKVSFKKKLSEYLQYQAECVRNAGIDIKLNCEVDYDFADSCKADVIIAALGAKPMIPRIDGIENDNVLSANDAYIKAESLGNKIVILGAGLVGTELAIHLSMLGKTVTVVEMMDVINDGGNFQHIKAVKIEMERNGVELHLSTKATKIDEGGVYAEGPDGAIVIEADNVIYAVGQLPLNDEAATLRSAAPVFYEIGDCVRPKNIMSATATAYEICRYLGRK